MDVALLICVVQPVLAQFPNVKTTTLNLRGCGWEAPDPIHPGEIDPAARRSIVIDHERRVLVGFVIRERSGLVTRDRPALTFRIVRFSPDGRSDLSLSLPTNGWRTNSVYLSATDQIIARANDTLQWLEPDADPTHAAKDFWRVIAPCGLRCRVTQSPSRRTLLLDTWDVDPPLTLIDTAQLAAARGCARGGYPINSITDQLAYSTLQSRADVYDYFSHKTPVAGAHIYRWPLCDYEHRVAMPWRIQGRYTVLNDELFIANVDAKAIRDIGRDLEVISSDGQVKFRQLLAKHEYWGNFFAPIRSSERGDRIAVDIMTVRGGNKKLDISSHMTARRIAVFDIEAGKELASVSVNPNHRYRFEFDLSPDGRRLAILEDDTVKVVDITEVGSW